MRIKLSNAGEGQSELARNQPLGRKLTKYSLVFIIGFAIVAILLSQTGIPCVTILGVDAKIYNVGCILFPKYRARIIASVHNYMSYSVIVTIKFEIEWAEEKHSDVKSATIAPHSTTDVEGYVQATDQWFNYSAKLMQVTIGQPWSVLRYSFGFPMSEIVFFYP